MTSKSFDGPLKDLIKNRHSSIEFEDGFPILKTINGAKVKVIYTDDNVITGILENTKIPINWYSSGVSQCGWANLVMPVVSADRRYNNVAQQAVNRAKQAVNREEARRRIPLLGKEAEYAAAAAALRKVYDTYAHYLGDCCDFCRGLPRGPENLKYDCGDVYGLVIDGDMVKCPSCSRVLAQWE